MTTTMRKIALVLAVAFGFVAYAGAAAPQAAHAAPACTKRAGKYAANHTAFAGHIQRRLGRFFRRGERVFDLFDVYRVTCRDLTDDGQGEMIVELGCCTGSSPDPWAIFVPDGRRWALGFDQVRESHFSLEVGFYESDYAGGESRWAVEQKLPDYEPGDPNCCPSGYSYRYTAWNGSRFVYDVRW